MAITKDFKKFISKGNILDLAVGVIIGGAFGKIISSLVGDVIMPLVGVLLGGIDFAGLTAQVGEATIAYGLFIQNIIDFLIIAICMFLFIRALDNFKKKEEKSPTPQAPSKEEALLTEIRDILKEN
jgi:large conductance mechanosensitive channel